MSRNHPAASSAVNTTISRHAMAPAQPQAMNHSVPNTRGSRELMLMIALRRQKVHLLGSNPVTDDIIRRLQESFEAQCLVDHACNTITDEEELAQRKVECVKAGLYALRSIHTAWLKYPAVGGRLMGAPIRIVDFYFTARSAAVDRPEGQLADQYTQIMAEAVDSQQDRDENAPHSQLRVNNCFLAIKKQFMALFPLLGHDTLFAYMFDDDVLSEDDAPTRTYHFSPSAALHPPSRAAQMMSARGLTEAAEAEDDDDLHIYVTDAVLRTKAEKRADLAEQVTKAKKAETDEAAKTKASASKPTAAVKGKGKARKIDTPPVESEEDDADDEEPETPVKKAAAKKVAAKKVAAKKAVPSKVRGGKKAAPSEDIEEEDEEENATTEQPVTESKAVRRKRPALEADAEDADGDDCASKPAPKKRAKSTPAGKSTISTGSSNQPVSSNASAAAGSVAPNIAKRGGAAPKWLKDEDDLVKRMMVAHPDHPMPTIYREYSLQVANTPYQRLGQASIQYRADFVEFPKGIFVSDKERRKFDIAHRTYESVRQHCESFKANVSKAHTTPPYTWTPCQDNIAAGQPKRAPPPRPAYFNNDARTPVPPLNPSAPLASASGPVAPVAPSVAAPRTRKSTGWNAVNNSSSDQAATQMADQDDEAVEESAEGDDLVSDMEDFFEQQSE
jgi:hypothetical protein